MHRTLIWKAEHENHAKQAKIDERRESTFHGDIVTTMNKAHQR